MKNFFLYNIIINSIFSLDIDELSMYEIKGIFNICTMNSMQIQFSDDNEIIKHTLNLKLIENISDTGFFYLLKNDIVVEFQNFISKSENSKNILNYLKKNKIEFRCNFDKQNILLKNFIKLEYAFNLHLKPDLSKNKILISKEILCMHNIYGFFTDIENMFQLDSYQLQRKFFLFDSQEKNNIFLSMLQQSHFNLSNITFLGDLEVPLAFCIIVKFIFFINKIFSCVQDEKRAENSLTVNVNNFMIKIYEKIRIIFYIIKNHNTQDILNKYFIVRSIIEKEINESILSVRKTHDKLLEMCYFVIAFDIMRKKDRIFKIRVFILFTINFFSTEVNNMNLLTCIFQEKFLNEIPYKMKNIISNYFNNIKKIKINNFECVKQNFDDKLFSINMFLIQRKFDFNFIVFEKLEYYFVFSNFIAIDYKTIKIDPLNFISIDSQITELLNIFINKNIVKKKNKNTKLNDQKRNKILEFLDRLLFSFYFQNRENKLDFINEDQIYGYGVYTVINDVFQYNLVSISLTNLIDEMKNLDNDIDRKLILFFYDMICLYYASSSEKKSKIALPIHNFAVLRKFLLDKINEFTSKKSFMWEGVCKN